jgi:hypothetical protein
MKKFTFWLVIIAALMMLFSLSMVGAPDRANGATAPIAQPAMSFANAPKPGGTKCKTVWLTASSYYDRIPTGAKRCLVIPKSGWVKVHQYDNPKRPVVDYVAPKLLTTVKPHSGGNSKAAKQIRALAKKHHVKLQFAPVDHVNRKGCESTGFWKSTSGTYQSSPYKPGDGLVRLGYGKSTKCIGKFQTNNVNVAKHEISHAIIERKCGKVISAKREEHITDAYAWKYLKASKASGNYGFTNADLKTAIKVHAGKC